MYGLFVKVVNGAITAVIYIWQRFTVTVLWIAHKGWEKDTAGR